MRRSQRTTSQEISFIKSYYRLFFTPRNTLFLRSFCINVCLFTDISAKKLRTRSGLFL
ncbi:hypothetical protein [Segatella oris]|uniref:hypothetical protein n=1 Tax=Segatella oris TaxID=28135 RepID=UPI0012DBCE1D|nr:hypothetical protein [Segatella oris]MBF1449274.1 hypothetical protein [Segatella oris]